MIRPQPLDLFPWPLGGLIVPDVDGGQALAADAIAGREVTAVGALEFWALAANDDLNGAHASLEGVPGKIADYNRFVLNPSAPLLKSLRDAFRQPLPDDPQGTLGGLLELAAFKSGLSSVPLNLASFDGELLASAKAASAAAAMEDGDARAAADLLVEAIGICGAPSPGLAAQLALSLVEVERAQDKPAARLVELLRQALETLGKDGFKTLRAELQLELGGVLQESGPTDLKQIQEASALFQAAVTHLDPEQHPRAHGFAQMRLGLCYMSMPMNDAGDALRMGVATQALKRAVEVLDPTREPDLWCSAAANLANAYQLLPSGHLAENIAKGLALYDQALDIRRSQGDPLGTARLLMNKAQAAATLEKRPMAIEALGEACTLLQDLRMSAELSMARHMQEDLRRQMTTAGEHP